MEGKGGEGREGRDGRNKDVLVRGCYCAYGGQMRGHLS